MTAFREENIVNRLGVQYTLAWIPTEGIPANKTAEKIFFACSYYNVSSRLYTTLNRYIEIRLSGPAASGRAARTGTRSTREGTWARDPGHNLAALWRMFSRDRPSNAETSSRS